MTENRYKVSVLLCLELYSSFYELFPGKQIYKLKLFVSLFVVISVRAFFDKFVYKFYLIIFNIR